jgi:hypothetical protein
MNWENATPPKSVAVLAAFSNFSKLNFFSSQNITAQANPEVHELRNIAGA